MPIRFAIGALVVRGDVASCTGIPRLPIALSAVKSVASPSLVEEGELLNEGSLVLIVSYGFVISSFCGFSFSLPSGQPF